MGRTYLVAGNWKMNGSCATNQALLDEIRVGMVDCPDVEMLVCPPAVFIQEAARAAAGTRLKVGGQDLSAQEKLGAYTGEIHGSMLKDLGCRYVIVGHSERRTLFGETDEIVARKFRTAQSCGLVPILCVGETLEEREAGQMEQVLQRQLNAVLKQSEIAAFAEAVIAYEPVWAIGTGRTASPGQAQDAHAYIRAQLAARDGKIASTLRVLYGGSVKADNAADLFACPDVDGGLIGGASLKAGDFLAICRAAQAQVR